MPQVAAPQCPSAKPATSKQGSAVAHGFAQQKEGGRVTSPINPSGHRVKIWKFTFGRRLRSVCVAGVIVSAVLTLLCGPAWAVDRHAPKGTPNVLFILIDDMGWKHLKCCGSDYYETRNMDALAESWIRFTNAYSASPLCSPTRASILTGKEPGRLRFPTPHSTRISRMKTTVHV